MHIDESMMNAKLIMRRAGEFGDCAINGEWYEHQNNTRFWRITIVSADNYRPVATERINLHCLVFGNEFHCRTAGVPLPEFSVAICNDAKEIEPLVKQGVLEEIRKWENEVTTS